MKKPIPPAASAVAFPITQVTIGDLVDRIDEQGLTKLLEEQMGEAFENYLNDWFALQQKLHGKDSYKLKDTDRVFRGATEYSHPLSRGRWASTREDNVTNQLAIALKNDDWQEVMVLGGMLCVREMLYGRAVKPAKATAPTKAKAERKPAKKKASKKKPHRQVWPMAARKAAPPKKSAPGKIATLEDLVEQAKPLFKKNPGLTREQLIKAIGRRYERITTLAALRTLCSVKTATTPAARSPLNPAAGWPFPTRPAAIAETRPPKPKRAQRDPARPVVLPESSIPKGVRTKPFPEPSSTGIYTADQADHVCDFGSGKVAADFAAIETENGWTYGYNIKVAGQPDEGIVLGISGPLAADPDTAIRDCSSDMMSDVKRLLKAAEPPTDEARALEPHVSDLLKLRSWLLGFQARGVEKIAFLKKGGQKDPFAAMEIAA